MFVGNLSSAQALYRQNFGLGLRYGLEWKIQEIIFFLKKTLGIATMKIAIRENK